MSLGAFRVSWLHLAILFFGSAIGALLFTSQAYAANNILVSLTLEDTNSNGKINQIEMRIDNDALENWAVDGTPQSAALSVTQSGQPITITGVTFESSNTADPLILNIALSEADSDLLTSTDGVNEAVMEVVYNDVDGTNTCTNCIRDTSGELGSFLNDDSGINVEVDGAKPVITTAAVTNVTSGGITYNAMQITYTENIRLSRDAGGDNDIPQGSSGASTATLGASTSVRTLAGFGSWDGISDCVGNAPTANTIASQDSSNNTVVTVMFNTDTSSYYTTCNSAPSGANVFTPTADASDLTDFNGNTVNTNVVAMSVSNGGWDVTVPTLSATYSCQTGAIDGNIGRIQMNWSEAMLDAASNTASFYEGDNDNANDGTGEETAAAWSTSTLGCDGGATVNTANDNKMSVSFTTGISGTDEAYLNLQTLGPRNHAGLRAALVAGGGTENDVAGPVLILTDPENDNRRLGPNGTVTLTFSEDVTAVTVHSNPSYDLTVDDDPSSDVVTFTPDNRWIPGDLIEFTIDTAEDATGNTFAGAPATGDVVHPFTLTVRRSDDATTSSTVTNSITLLTPEGGETYEAGEDIEITWNTEGTGISYVDIAATYNGTTVTVANNTADDGSYTWMAPDIAADDVVITVTGTDLATDIDADSSEEFTIGTVEADDEDEDSGDTSSPAGDVEVGQYIKGVSFSTVYYVDENDVRRPFMDAQTFLTYEDDFDNVVTVTDAVLATLTMGGPMLPNPGVVLIKLQSIPKVYAMDADGELRWVTSESIATSLFGSNWANYVIDLPDTLWPRFTVGDDVERASELDVDTSDMKTRAEVNR